MIHSDAPGAFRDARAPSALMMLGPAALFWVGAVLTQEFNRKGFAEAAVLLAFLVSVVAMLARSGRSQGEEHVGAGRALAAIVLLLVVVQLGYAGARLWHPHASEIAHATFAGSQAMLRGENPYSVPIDPVALKTFGSRFQGYKYLPLMGWAYVPLGVPFGDRGLVATNLLLQVATGALVWHLARTIGTETAGRMATCLYLAVPLVVLQVLFKVSTDLVAVVPLLAALAFWRLRPGVAGLLVGVSIAAKLAPGALFVPCLLPATARARWRYLLGLAVGVSPVLPYAIQAPQAFFDNIVLFNAVRPGDASSWLLEMPTVVAWVAHGMLVLLFLAIAIGVWWRGPTLFVRCALCTILMLAALLLGPSPHQNYHLWWLPFYSVLLAVTLTKGSRTDSGAVPT